MSLPSLQGWRNINFSLYNTFSFIWLFNFYKNKPFFYLTNVFSQTVSKKESWFTTIDVKKCKEVTILVCFGQCIIRWGDSISKRWYGNTINSHLITGLKIFHKTLMKFVGWTRYKIFRFFLYLKKRKKINSDTWYPVLLYNWSKLK